jgi:DNA-binding Xre family transcriptional regulator
MNKEQLNTLLGSAIKKVRIARGETLSSMSYKLNYKDESAYHKIETGKVKDLSLLRFLEVCHALKVCPHYVYRLAGIDVDDTFNEFESYEDFLNFVNTPPPRKRSD